LLADENFPFSSFKFLENLEYDIVHIGKDFPSITDREVMEFSMNENRITITFDSDYGELVFKYGYQSIGVIYLRLKDFKPQYPEELIHQIIVTNEIDLLNQLTVIDENQIRQRKIN